MLRFKCLGLELNFIHMVLIGISGTVMIVISHYSLRISYYLVKIWCKARQAFKKIKKNQQTTKTQQPATQQPLLKERIV